MDILVIAVPSENPGGLDAAIGQHFGHCDVYTIVEARGREIMAVRTLPNVPHQQGGCMAPVNHLARNGVKVLIAGGMGMRPLMGFHQVGVQVVYGAEAISVGHAIQAFLAGALPAFRTENTCGGGQL
jgi:predicted Fe-Mo cluster-binding NifX family protein